MHTFSRGLFEPGDPLRMECAWNYNQFHALGIIYSQTIPNCMQFWYPRLQYYVGVSNKIYIQHSAEAKENIYNNIIKFVALSYWQE